MSDGGFSIIALSKVEDGKLDQATQLGGDSVIKQALERAKADQYFSMLVDELRSQAEIVIHKKSSDG